MARRLSAGDREQRDRSLNVRPHGAQKALMTTPHTQGPWDLVDGRIEAADERWGQSSGTVILALVLKHRLGAADRVPPTEVQRANATLMIAAPDLLQSLRTLVDEPTWNRTLAPRERDALDNARAAIAKAEGREAVRS